MSNLFPKKTEESLIYIWEEELLTKTGEKGQLLCEVVKKNLSHS